MRHKQAKGLEGRGGAVVAVEAFVMLLFCMYVCIYVCVYVFFQSTFALLIITLLPLAQAASTATAAAGGAAIKGC